MPNEINAIAENWAGPMVSPNATKAAIVVSIGAMPRASAMDHAQITEAVGTKKQRIVAELNASREE
ncbi:hypothetical protein ABIB75_008158 [Bradyrhizobium sp. GM2.2]|uniref:hypothetical protein n=1 Tax=unclassified Bradyrhizobium TaxID=2631580 RepID=UPI001FFBE5CE|nr:hypothetical protein [Bradyrhizobium sp. 145]MCK1688977.1 hypothetical protein [Bradyrhizobium sp. 145]